MIDPNRCTLVSGDSLATLKTLKPGAFRCCVTSPPYWGLRDYGVEGQLGLEKTPEEYVAKLVEMFCEVRRVLTDDGSLWLNLGDSYYRDSKKGQHRPGDSGKQAYIYDSGHGRANAGSVLSNDRDNLKPKDLVGIPWRVAFALQADGWWLRSDIIWAKPNPMPESVTDRPTRAHEYLFLLTKSPRYFYDHEAAKEKAVAKTTHDLTGSGYSAPGQKPQTGTRVKGRKNERLGRTVVGFQDRWDASEKALTRNRRSVWTIPPEPYKGAHFAVMPTKLVEPCVLVGSAVGDALLDPFCGSGTVGVVAMRTGRRFVGLDLNPAYLTLAEERIAAEVISG